QDVRRLQVAMADPLDVNAAERLCHSSEEVQGLPDRQPRGLTGPGLRPVVCESAGRARESIGPREPTGQRAPLRVAHHVAWRVAIRVARNQVDYTGLAIETGEPLDFL